MPGRGIGCGCGPCKPRWMRMVDNIYSGNADSSNHSKLVFFCVRKPDKLDRIAGYLHRRLASDLNRRNYNYVNLTMEAINSLLNACHAQRLNMFVVSFLKMVQLLLETRQPDLQILGTKSFVEFSQIVEDTPSYHREFDDLISHFSSMCHSPLTDLPQRNRIRVAGIHGIQGIIRKTTTDQLQVNVLQADGMDKIIPSLLLNIKEGFGQADDRGHDEENPFRQAIFAFKDIVCRASYLNIKPVMRSILIHFDNHQLWVPKDFPLFVFELLLDSIKNTQSAHSVVKQLVEHLSGHESDHSPAERTGIVEVIGKAVISLAKEAVGPDVFHNFKSLLQMLRSSIDKTSQEPGSPEADDISGEQHFQGAIISTIAEFAKNLPDTQKIEIMKFILNFDPMVNLGKIDCDRSDSEHHKPLIKVLLRTMLTVATQYKTVAISNAFNTDFLNLLLRGTAIDPDPGIRIIVQKILHTLIDRHDNAEQLMTVRVYNPDTLREYFKWEKPTRQDVMFMKRTGAVLIENLFRQTLDVTNKVDNLEHVYCTLGLVALEMGQDQVIVDLFRLVLQAQRLSADPEHKMPLTHRCAVHAMLAAYITLVAQLANAEPLEEYVHQVIQARDTTAPYLLPRIAFNRANTADTYPAKILFSDELLFQEEAIRNHLKEASYDVTQLGLPFGLASSSGLHRAGYPRKFSTFAYMNDQRLGAADPMAQSMSNFSLADSDKSTPEMPRKVPEEDDLSFEAMRRIMNESSDVRRLRRSEEEKRLIQYFKTADFEDICQHQKEKSFPVRAKLTEVLDSIAQNIERGTLVENHYLKKPPAVWDIEYPTLFVS